MQAGSLGELAASTAVRVRPVREEELLQVARVNVRSMRSLSRRHGKPPTRMRPLDILPFMRHAFATDPKGFQVAVSKGKVVCFAITILRGETHFLAEFFALPGSQGKGIGRKVLTRAFAESMPPREAARCLVASPDVRAQGLYMKFGMQPRTVVYHFAGRPGRPRDQGRLQLSQVGPTGESTGESREIAARFDLPLREARRDADQRYFLSAVPGSRFYQAKQGTDTAGYIVIRGKGAIGPGGVSDAALSGDLLTKAVAKAHELRLKEVSIWAPGLNQGAIRAAFDAGLKVDFTTVWMAARPIGNLESYIPSGGVLF